VTGRATIQFKKPHHGSLSFEDGQPVAVAPFDYPDEPDGAQPTDTSQDALEALEHGLLVVIRGGHRDGALVRAGALARICGLFDTDSEAAVAVGRNRSSMTRAVHEMKHGIQRALRNKKKCQAKQ
jgi:molybdate-binding protein